MCRKDDLYLKGVSVIKKQHINYITCKICGKEMNTGMCYTRLGRWIRTKAIKRKHWHTKAEVLGKQMFGIYIPTTDRKRDV